MKRSFFTCEDGASAVELAVLVPTFALLLMGVIDMTRYGYYAILTAHAARAAVQYGAQNEVDAANTSGMTSAAQADAPGLSLAVTPGHYCIQNGAAVTCTTGEPNSSTIYFVQVTVTSTIHSIFHYPGIPTSLPLSATAAMRIAQQ